MNGQTVSETEDVAARWVARMDSENWSEDQEAELEEWLHADPGRRGALLRAKAMWLALERRGQEVGTPADKPDRGTNSLFGRRAALAGGLTALAASLALVFLPRGAQVYDTQVGEIRQVPLTDGSAAAINTDSRIAVEMKPEIRLVRLDAGEAWFKVAKNSARPFVVQAGDVRVQAVGTAFSVRRRNGAADILVTEGVVSVWSDRESNRKFLVRAGGRATVSATRQFVEPASNAAEVDRQLAWRTGKIALVEDKLSEAVAEFNRHNQRKIVLLDEQIGGERVDGVFRTNEPEAFAIAVSNLLGVPLETSNVNEIRLGAPQKKRDSS